MASSRADGELVRVAVFQKAPESPSPAVRKSRLAWNFLGAHCCRACEPFRSGRIFDAQVHRTKQLSVKREGPLVLTLVASCPQLPTRRTGARDQREGVGSVASTYKERPPSDARVNISVTEETKRKTRQASQGSEEREGTAMAGAASVVSTPSVLRLWTCRDDGVWSLSPSTEESR